MEISQIKPNPNNPRIIKDEKYQKLLKSIREFPQMLEKRPLVCFTDTDGKVVVLGGNMRLKACQEIGLKEVPVSLADDWSEEQKKEFLIKDNLGYGEWDWDTIANEWDVEQLSDWGMDIPDFVTAKEAVEDDFEISDQIETDIVLGDLFEIGEHRLLCGDSTDPEQVARLMNGEKADMVFTDPPYGVNYDGGHATSKRREKLEGDDTTALYPPTCLNAFAFSKDNAPLYLWHAAVKGYAAAAAAAAAAAGYEIRCELIWNKNMAQFGAIGAQYKQKHEPCFYCFKKGKSVNWIGENNEVTVWDCNRSSKNEYHPTQKPIELCQRAIGNHHVSLILDLFGGSGSTMVACHQMGKKAYLQEFAPKYCQVIVDRMIKLDPSMKVLKNGQEYVNNSRLTAESTIK